MKKSGSQLTNPRFFHPYFNFMLGRSLTTDRNLISDKYVLAKSDRYTGLVYGRFLYSNHKPTSEATSLELINPGLDSFFGVPGPYHLERLRGLKNSVLSILSGKEYGFKRNLMFFPGLSEIKFFVHSKDIPSPIHFYTIQVIRNQKDIVFELRETSQYYDYENKLKDAASEAIIAERKREEESRRKFEQRKLEEKEKDLKKAAIFRKYGFEVKDSEFWESLGDLKYQVRAIHEGDFRRLDRDIPILNLFLRCRDQYSFQCKHLLPSNFKTLELNYQTKDDYSYTLWHGGYRFSRHHNIVITNKKIILHINPKFEKIYTTVLEEKNEKFNNLLRNSVWSGGNGLSIISSQLSALDNLMNRIGCDKDMLYTIHENLYRHLTKRKSLQEEKGLWTGKNDFEIE